MIKIQGIASQGGVNISTSGTTSTTESIGSFPGSTVTIYNTGTSTLATIYSDAAGTPKANPFSSSSTDASWSCYVTHGRYDVRFSGTGITSPFTLSDFVITPLEYTLEEFGAIGNNSANDTDAINAAFDFIPDGSTLRLNGIYRHTGVTLDHKAQISIIGSDSLDGYIDPGWAPGFIYVGANGGTAITLSNVYACTFKGFFSYAAATNTVPGTTGAAKNFYLTWSVGGSPPVTSQCVFQSIKAQSIGTRTDHRVIDVSNANLSNNEFHSFRDCKLYGGNQGFGLQTGTGLYLGHSNVKQIRIERTTFAGLAKGIEGVGNPSFRGFMNTFNGCGINYFGSFSDATVMIGDDSEGSTQVIDCQGQSGNAPIIFIGGRYNDLHGGQTVSATGSDAPAIDGAGMNFESCQFSSASGAFTSDFLVNTSGTSAITWRNNHVSGISIANLSAGLDTFAYCVDDIRSPGAAGEHGYQAIRGGVLFPRVTTLTGTTPDFGGNASLHGAKYYRFANGSATSVVDVASLPNGSEVVIIGDANTTIVNNAVWVTRSGSNIVPAAGKTTSWYKDDTGVMRQIN